MGAWIEIVYDYFLWSVGQVAPFVGAWIEILNISKDWQIIERRSLRGSVD